MKQLTITAIGHVDHGKSTLLGRLLSETGAVPKERRASAEARAAELGRPFEYAFLLDALQEEQAKNITVDLSRFRFRTRRCDFTVIDAPGHKEFLKNMVSGAASADAVILLVDASEGLRDQSRRHAYLLRLLGIRQIVVAVNKLDLAGYDRGVFEGRRREIESYLGELGLAPTYTIPVAAALGENVTRASLHMPWNEGPTLLEALEALEPAGTPDHLPLRFPVQDVYRSDGRQIAVGRLEAGRLHAGECVQFWPSELPRAGAIRRPADGRIRSTALAGESIALAIPEGVALDRGEIGARVLAAPRSGVASSHQSLLARHRAAAARPRVPAAAGDCRDARARAGDRACDPHRVARGRERRRRGRALRGRRPRARGRATDPLRPLLGGPRHGTNRPRRRRGRRGRGNPHGIAHQRGWNTSF